MTWLTRPKPFSLSSSNTIVRRFKNAMPVRLRNCESKGSRTLTWVLGSTFFCTVWFRARIVYPTMLFQ